VPGRGPGLRLFPSAAAAAVAGVEGSPPDGAGLCLLLCRTARCLWGHSGMEETVPLRRFCGGRGGELGEMLTAIPTPLRSWPLVLAR